MSAVCAGVVSIHTPSMGVTKGAVMSVVAHGGLKLTDALFGLVLRGRG